MCCWSAGNAGRSSARNPYLSSSLHNKPESGPSDLRTQCGPRSRALPSRGARDRDPRGELCRERRESEVVPRRARVPELTVRVAQ